MEADLDGTGFQVLDPTPAAGLPGMRAYSLLSRLASLGREIEFFYDRRVLGFDAADQAGAMEAMRESLGTAASSLTALRQSARGLLSSGTVAGVLSASLLSWLLALLAQRRRRAAAPATRAYLALRRLLARRRGSVSAATPPEEVARLLAEEVPSALDDASAVVSIYCASAFGGLEPDAAGRRELAERLKRLRRLA